MFQSWYQSKESSNEILLILTILFVVFGAFVTLIWWIIKLSRQNRLSGVAVNESADEISEERMRTAKKLEIFKQFLSNSDENDEEQLENNQLANAIASLDYYYLSKWGTQLREAVDTNSLDLTVQQVIREIDDHVDLLQLSLDTKQELWDLAQLTDSIYIRNN